ncbi:MAG: VOC family protein [Frankia sp.]
MTTIERQNSVLNWVNVFSRNLEDLPRFYAEVFGFTEIDYMRNSVFRGFSTGGSALGFLAPDVYSILELEDYSSTSGAGFLLNFETESSERVHELVETAVAAGARVVKQPYETSYGWYQSVLMDPEENVFRINHILSDRTVT